MMLNLFKGPMLYVTGALAVALLALSMLYTAALKEQGALEENAKGMQMAVEHWQDAYQQQEEDFQHTQWLLAARQMERDKLRKQTTQLKQSLQELRQSDEMVKQYMDTAIPDAVFDILRQQNNGDPEPSNPGPPTTSPVATGLPRPPD